MKKYWLNAMWTLLIIYFFTESLTAQNINKKFIFIGHCYQTNTVGNKVDYRLEQLDLSE